MTHLLLRRAWNQQTCTRCRRVFDGPVAVCPDCAATLGRLAEARRVLAAANAERRFPPPRRPWP
jgi:hypothetical protein